MKNKIIKISVIVLIVFLVFAFVKNPIIKSVVSVTSSHILGAPVKIGSLSMGVFRTAVSVKDFKIYNPKGFPKEILLDIPQISVDYDLASLFKGEIHINSMIFNLKEIVLVKNEEGVLNVDSLRVSESAGTASRKNTSEEVKPSKLLKLQIDLLKLTIGKVVYKDYSNAEPTTNVYEVNITDKVFKDIKSAQQLAALIISEPLKSAGVRGAAIYGAATLLGVGFLPAGVAGVLIAKDSAEHIFKSDYDKVYERVINVINQMGRVVSEDREKGLVTAAVSGAKVNIELVKGDKGVKMVVSARKYFLPKPEIAAGIIHNVLEKVE